MDAVGHLYRLTFVYRLIR